MMSCSESHLRIYKNLILSFWSIIMECTVYAASVINNDRLEIILFPLLIPVLILCMNNGILNVYSFKRKITYHIIKLILIEKRLLNICFFSFFPLYKTFETYIDKFSRENIVYNFVAWIICKCYFQIFHIDKNKFRTKIMQSKCR